MYVILHLIIYNYQPSSIPQKKSVGVYVYLPPPEWTEGWLWRVTRQNDRLPQMMYSSFRAGSQMYTVNFLKISRKKLQHTRVRFINFTIFIWTLYLLVFVIGYLLKGIFPPLFRPFRSILGHKHPCIYSANTVSRLLIASQPVLFLNSFLNLLVGLSTPPDLSQVAHISTAFLPSVLACPHIRTGQR